jgi:hypothetical protein
MNRILVLTISFLLFSTCLKSQEKIKLFYNSDWKITNEKNATYYREAVYDLNNFELDGKVFDYTLSGNLMMEGEYQHKKKIRKFYFLPQQWDNQQ